MEDALRNTFLPYLFKGDTSHIPGRVVTGVPVNHSGIALTDPTHTFGANCTASCIITGHLVTEIHGTAEFRSGYHALLMGEGRYEIRRWHAEAVDTELREAWANASM